MRKSVILLFTISLMTFLSGCNTPESTSPVPKTNEEKPTETPTETVTVDYKWLDVSDTTYNFGSVNDFSYSTSTKTILAHKNSGNESYGNILRNFLLSSLGRQEVTGFEADVKIGNHMNSCGFELSGPPSYSGYWFMVKSDGSFVIKLHDYRSGTISDTVLLTQSAGRSHINLDDFNTIKMISLPNGKDAEVYVNGNLVYTIRDLIFTKGTFAVYYQAKQGTYSTNKIATAEYKVKSIQKIKN